MTPIIFGLYFGLSLSRVQFLITDLQKCGDVYAIKRDVAGHNAVVALTFDHDQLKAIEVRFIPSGSQPDLAVFCEAEILDRGDDLIVFERVTKSLLVKGGIPLDWTDTRRIWLRGKTWIELKTSHSIGTVLTFVDSTWNPEVNFFWGDDSQSTEKTKTP